MNEKVLQWAEEKGLLKAENKHAQMIKLTEEVGELASAILKGDVVEQVDAIGDIQVVLIILSKQLGVEYDTSLILAYDEIKDRKGEMVDGSFIKNNG